MGLTVGADGTPMAEPDGKVQSVYEALLMRSGLVATVIFQTG
jgi:hypothetical protein